MGDGRVKRQPPAHRVAQPVGRRRVQVAEQRRQIDRYPLHVVASHVFRRVALAVAGQIDGDYPIAAGQRAHQPLPVLRAAGEAVEQDERLAASRLDDVIAQAVDLVVAAHARSVRAANCSASSCSATARRCTLPELVRGSSSTKTSKRGCL